MDTLNDYTCYCHCNFRTKTVQICIFNMVRDVSTVKFSE